MSILNQPVIVITGGAGFIGSNLIRYLNDQGKSNIVVVDELGQDEKWKNLVGKSFIDILEKEQLFSWLQGREKEIKAIIHLGACSDTTEKDASFLLKNNYQYTLHLAKYALSHDIRFIYASSAATYGDGAFGFSDDHDLLSELKPLNMYGYSKHLFDLWAKKEGVLDKVVGLKYFNVFGPNEWHKGRMASVVYHVTPKAQNEKVIKLFKSSDPKNFVDGGQQRDFIYVQDAVRMTASFLDNQVGGIFNIGRGVPETWNTLASSIFEAVELPCNIEYFAMPIDLLKKYQNYTCADMKKTKEVLKQAADCQRLQESVKDYIQHYLIPEKIC